MRKERQWGKYKTIMRMERGKNNKGRSMSKSCTYAIGDTTKDVNMKLYGVFERKE